MHYKNGREARLGDQVVFKAWDGNIKCGILTSAQATSTTCNGQIQPALGGNTECQTIGELYHAEDLYLIVDSQISAAAVAAAQAAMAPTSSAVPGTGTLPGKVAALLIALAMLLFGYKAPAQQQIPSGILSLLTVSNSVTTNYTGTPLVLPAGAIGQPWAITISNQCLVGSNSLATGANAGVVCGFDLLVAGQWTTSLPLQCTAPTTGANGYCSYFYINPTNTIGAKAIRLDYFNMPQTNPLTAFNIWLDWNHVP